MSKNQRLLCVIYANSITSLFHSANNACLNIISQIFEQKGYKNLGNLSVFLIFALGLVGNFFCVTYIKRYNYNLMFFFHAMGYLFFVAQGVLVCYCNDDTYAHETYFCTDTPIILLVIISSIITGFLASGFWISQNDYISECSDPQNIGLFYGVGWALVQCSLLIGSLYSSYAIEPLGQFKFFCLMFLIGFLSNFLFLFVKQPPPNHSQNYVEVNISQYDQSESQIQQSLEQQEKKQWKAEEFYKLKISQQLLQLYYTMKQPKVILINFPIMVTGIMLSFQYTVMHLLVENSVDQIGQSQESINSLTFRVVICLGVTEVLGGIATSYLNDVFSKVKVLIFFNCLFQLALIIALINVFIKSYTLCFVVSAIWGFIDCGTTSALLSLLTEHFGDDVRIFCDFNFFQCLGGMLGTSITILMADTKVEWLILLVLIWQMIANVLLQAWSRFYQYGEDFLKQKVL